ncbi:MAG TPA: cytochrome P460 family protein [Terriglobales bacterium]|nr:cytochrome P460 family protein [Terriglobales bacterium]
MTRRISSLIPVLLGISFVVFALVVLAGHHPVKAQGRTMFNGYELVDKTGNIRKPTDYRDRYELLGTYTILDPKGNEMHVTYASPGTAAYYRKTGKFPDGAVLVKEVFGTDHAKLTTGDAHWASGIKVWFVQIKDTKNRFPNNKLWGDGWGWALFKADAPDKQVATDYKKDCLGCHVPAQSTDWTYIQGYPVLKSSK